VAGVVHVGPLQDFDFCHVPRRLCQLGQLGIEGKQRRAQALCQGDIHRVVGMDVCQMLVEILADGTSVTAVG
jgi:hypothetical protein